MTLQVVKRPGKLIPVENWDVRSVLGKLRMSFDTANNLIYLQITYVLTYLNCF